MACATVAGWWRAAEDGRLVCELCPRLCRLRDGQRGFCFVRQRQGEAVVLTSYGRSTGFFADPIEKKPLFHFRPGSLTLSFGAAGCNLRCRFCENWALSRTTNPERMSYEANPAKIAARAGELGLPTIAFTYNEPLVSAELVLDVAAAARERGIASVAISSGYATPEAARTFYGAMDAVCIGLKGFGEEGYETHSAAKLAPVLRTLEVIRQETATWLELSLVLIPGTFEASDVATRCAWIVERLGADTPLHLLPFRPSFELVHLPATTLEEARRVRTIARSAGLRHVYIHGDAEHADTRCAACDAVVISRDASGTVHAHARDGRCPACQAPVAGRFDARVTLCEGDRWQPARWCG